MITMDSTPPRDLKPSRPVLQSRVVRLFVSTTIGLLLILLTVEVSRLITFYQESSWMTKLADWYVQQAVAAEQKAATVRQHAAAPQRFTKPEELLQEAEKLARQAQDWRKKAQGIRDESQRRAFHWWPHGAARAAPNPGLPVCSKLPDALAGRPNPCGPRGLRLSA